MVAEGAAAEAVPFKPNGVREQSLPYILSCIREGRHDEVLMGWANAQLKAAGITGRGEKDLDLIRRATVILDAVRAQTSYAPDPPGSEVIKKPHLLLCLKERCIPIGDCDDLAGATGAAMMSVGIPTYAVHQKFGGDAQEHVLLGVIDELGRKWYIDPSTNDPPYQGSRARSEQWLSPMDVPSKSTGQTGPEFVTLGKAPLYQRPAIDPIAAQCGLGRVGLSGFVLPGDILAYRAAWDEYVADSVRVALACAQAMENVAANQTDPAVKSNLQSQAQAIREKANALWQEWNIYAGQTDEFIVLEGAAILQTFQQSVIDAGDLRQSITTGPLACSLTYPKDGQQVVAAAGPDPSVQAEIISHIEGLGILAKGFLQIFVDTSIGGLQSAGTAAQWIAEQGKKVVEKSISSPWPWIVALLIGTGVIGIVYAPEIKAAMKTMTSKPRRT
jgi:hypothetical protein